MSNMPFQSRISAEVTLKGMSPYSQSRKHDAPKLERESDEDYDIRTWRQTLPDAPPKPDDTAGLKSPSAWGIDRRSAVLRNSSYRTAPLHYATPTIVTR